MRRIADIAVYSERGDPALAVEVKTRTGASKKWAAELYGDLADYYGAANKKEGSDPPERHDAPFGTPYFLLALPDVLYLWTPGRDACDPPESPRVWAEWSTAGSRKANRRGPAPAYNADTREVLSPYLEDVHYPLEDLRETGLEALLSSWLSELVAPWYAEETKEGEKMTEGSRRLVFDSGLYRAVRGGTVKVQAVT